MQSNTMLYCENSVFDSRLVESNLMDNWNSAKLLEKPNQYYKQFTKDYPWSTVGHTTYYSRPNRFIPNSDRLDQLEYFTHPEKNLELVPASRMTPRNNVSSVFSQNSTTEISRFPNIVTEIEKNPQQATEMALQTRYTPSEWLNQCLSLYTESNANRKQSELVRTDVVRVIRECDDKTSQGQRDSNQRIGERLTDVTFWRNELNNEHDKLLSEISALSDCKRRVLSVADDLEAPLKVTKECLYAREARTGIEKVHDTVEKNLIAEVDCIQIGQEQLKNISDKITKQLSDLRAAQDCLEDDITHKESTLCIDTVCHKLNNFSRDINYFGGIEKYDPTISSIESWANASNMRINRSQSERKKSSQLRSDAIITINTVTTSVLDHWNSTNIALNHRSSELCEAKSKIQMHLHKLQQEINDLEKHIEMLRKALQDKSNPLKVAQTRLETRAHREDLELCRDFAQLRLVQEVSDLQECIANLQNKLRQAESQHQYLLKTRTALEADFKRKANALFIDRERCIGFRRFYPGNSLIKY